MFALVLAAVAVLMAAGALITAGVLVCGWLRARAVLRTGVRTAGRCVRVLTGVDSHGGHVRSRRRHAVE
ncbi:hypothetical protein LO771_27630 [Streptacidiphilus sp. ASG 303]|uniref:hypothetical protein n=1 Tax=Streptacidiphilus sp. ASG 303 TaxID=2896847 RepID=UPI001E4547BD|nr:hypothetical protein [Streptacidiphilus sp. ASG 303]MCD0486055.1 hypothetical protein [Streptacidiphilus sp. ASG 303]